jgi:hypothetical protein
MYAGCEKNEQSEQRKTVNASGRSRNCRKMKCSSAKLKWKREGGKSALCYLLSVFSRVLVFQSKYKFCGSVILADDVEPHFSIWLVLII